MLINDFYNISDINIFISMIFGVIFVFLFWIGYFEYGSWNKNNRI